MKKAIPTYNELQEQLIRSKREIKKLKADRRNLENDIKRNEIRRDILYRLSQHAGSIDGLLDFILNEAIILTGSKIGYIYRYDESDKKFTINTWSKDVMKECTIIEKQTVYQLEKTGIWGEAVRQAKPIIVNDFQASHHLKKGYPEGHVPLKNFMTIPVFIEGHIVGVAGAANKDTGYDDTDVMQITLLMDSAWKLIERKYAKEALEVSETRYRRLFETAQDGILILDALSGKITDVNPFLIEMLGYVQEDFLGKQLWEIGAFRDIEASRAAFSELQYNGYVRYEDLPLETKDGRYIEVEFVSNCYLVDHHKVIQCNIRDITDRKRAEQALSMARDNLEEQVRIRTTQLRTMAIELSQVEQRERKRLAEVIHDNLQQLLVGAKWGIQAAQKKIRDEGLLQSLEQTAELITESIKCSRSLVAELSPPILHNEGLIAAVKWLGRWMGEIHGIIVKIKVGTEIEPDSEGISFLLFQSVRELLLNSVKYSKVKSVTVLIESIENQIKITVSDGGVGFDSTDMRKHIFEPGFGLSSMRERLGLVGGSLKIDTSPGFGTSVLISVPLPVAEMYMENDRNKLEVSLWHDINKTVEEQQRSSKIRVLIVDDHKIMREGLRGVLSSATDIEIAGEASDGKNAVEMAKQLRPDIVIMDVNMPGMNGIEATRHITSEMPDIKVIGLSMHEEEDKANAMLEAGAVDYIHKAGPSQELISSIREHRRVF
jgi:two-component system, sensor histidine kinase and response regulator